MEILVVIAMAILATIVAFFKGKEKGARDGFWDAVDEHLAKIDEEVEQGNEDIREKEGEIDEIDDELRDNQARDISPEEAIRILRERYGWVPGDLGHSGGNDS